MVDQLTAVQAAERNADLEAALRKCVAHAEGIEDRSFDEPSLPLIVPQAVISQPTMITKTPRRGQLPRSRVPTPSV